DCTECLVRAGNVMKSCRLPLYNQRGQLCTQYKSIWLGYWGNKEMLPWIHRQEWTFIDVQLKFTAIIRAADPTILVVHILDHHTRPHPAQITAYKPVRIESLAGFRLEQTSTIETITITITTSQYSYCHEK